MYIAPNSTIRLLSGVPIDKNQSDTLWFASVGAQTSYFMSKTVKTVTDATYQRLQRGYSRVEVPADQIYGCNYMMFQNTSFGNKWFYAFINNVEYINNEVSEIRFTIDPVQTWFFDYTLNQCFVERCTPTADEIGDNILPEPVGLGEYVVNNNDYTRIGADTRDMGFIVSIIDPQHTAGLTGGGIYDGVVSASLLYAFDATPAGVALFNEKVLNYQPILQAPDAVQAVYMCPKALLPSQTALDSTELSDHLIAPQGTVYEEWVAKPQITKQTTLDGYLPRNAKCYTYPYTFFHVDNGQSGSLITRYEFFRNLQPHFHITANKTYPIELVLYPYLYKNVVGENNVNAEYRGEKLSIKGFPQCSWSMDAYTAWQAQNSVPYAIKGGANLAKMVVGGIAAGGLGLGVAGASAIGFIEDIMSSTYTASIAADIAKGSVDTGSNDVASRRLVFKGGCMTQPYNYIKSIDEFFDAFGYAKREWMDVNIHARSRWTYVKTVGANVDGNVPADDAKYIADCYDRGIRFWADTAHPCDYSTANGFLS